MFVPLAMWFGCGVPGVRITRRFWSSNHVSCDRLAHLPVRGVFPLDVYRIIQKWQRRVRIRCKPRVPRVGGLLIFSVSGALGRSLLGIGYGFVVFVGIVL